MVVSYKVDGWNTGMDKSDNVEICRTIFVENERNMGDNGGKNLT